MRVGFLELIKQAARDTFYSLKPCDYFFGRAEVTDGELTVRLSDKAWLGADALLFGSKAARSGIEDGDRLVLLRKQGGGQYYVLDWFGKEK